MDEREKIAMGEAAREIEAPGPGIYAGVPANEYHSWPYVSSSYLKKLACNPFSAKQPTEVTAAMNIGSAVHAYTLEGEAAFLREFAIAPDCDKRTAAGKKDFAEFQVANIGKTVLTVGEFETVLACHQSLMDHPLSSLFLMESKGQPEVSLVWDDKETGLRCKARLDRLPDPSKKTVFDLKTCRDASRKGFMRNICGLNWDIQAGHYVNGATACGLEVDAWIFIGVQTSGTFQVIPAMLDEEWLKWGRFEANRLIRFEAECQQMGRWPNYEIPDGCASLLQITPHDLLEVFEIPAWR